MATYQSTRVSTGVPARSVAGITHVYASYPVTVALVTNDIIQMCKVPAKARILECTLSSDADPATTTCNLSLGDTGDTDRLITSTSYTTAGGTITRLNNPAGQHYQYTDETIISVTAVGIGTGTTDSTLRLHLVYTTDQE